MTCHGEWWMVVWFNEIEETEREPSLGREDFKLVWVDWVLDAFESSQPFASILMFQN